MADMYIRRGKSPSAGRPRARWWILSLLAILVVLGGYGWYERKHDRPEGSEPKAGPVTPVGSLKETVPSAGPAAAPEDVSTPGLSPPVVPSPSLDPNPSVMERRAKSLLEEARSKRQENDLGHVRALAMEALEDAQTAETRRAAQDLLGEIHIQMVFNPYPMEEKVEYVVERGDSLDTLARRFGTTVELLQKGNNIPNPSAIRTNARLRILPGPFRIEISKSENELVVYLHDRFFKRYTVGTGRYDQTPTGQTLVTERMVQPTWYRPDGRVVPYGHADNELGTHWLSLDIPGYGIHGTWEPETVGKPSSAGCIRLVNEDIEELFTLIPVGTEVVIFD